MIARDEVSKKKFCVYPERISLRLTEEQMFKLKILKEKHCLNYTELLRMCVDNYDFKELL